MPPNYGNIVKLGNYSNNGYNYRDLEDFKIFEFYPTSNTIYHKLMGMIYDKIRLVRYETR